MKPFQTEKSCYMNSIETTHTLCEILRFSQIWDTRLMLKAVNEIFSSKVWPVASKQIFEILFFYSFIDQQDMILIYSCKFCIIILWGVLYYNVPAKEHWKTMETALGIYIQTHNPSRWPGSHTHCQAQRRHAKQCICQLRNMTHFLAPLRLQPIFKEHTLSFSEPFCLAYQDMTFDLIESWFSLHGNSPLINGKWYT